MSRTYVTILLSLFTSLFQRLRTSTDRVSDISPSLNSFHVQFDTSKPVSYSRIKVLTTLEVKYTSLFFYPNFSLSKLKVAIWVERKSH